MENALSRLALDLSHDGISLHRLESGAWIMLDHIPLQVGTLKSNMARLRDLAEKSGGKVLVWMPAEQIHVRQVATGSLKKPDRISAARAAFAESGAARAEAMEFHFGPMAEDGTAPVAAIEASVLEEAREFIAQHGFQATGFSTRSRIEAFHGKPHFAATEPRGQVAGQALAAVAGIALAVGVGSLVWTGIGLFTRSSEPAFEVSSLLPPPGQEGAPLPPSSSPSVAPPSLADAATAAANPIAPPETGTGFAAYYAFPDDQNAVQIAVPGAFSAENPPEPDLLPGPDASVNPPRVAATLDPGQEGDTIPNIFTGNVQEEVTRPEPPRPTLLGLTPPDISAPAGRARALSGLEIRQPATATADFLVPSSLPAIPEPEVTDSVARLPDYFPVYLPVSPMADTPGPAPSAAAIAPPVDTAPDPHPGTVAATDRPTGQHVVAEASSSLVEDALPDRLAAVETLPLVPLLPGQAQPGAGPSPLPAWSDSLPPPPATEAATPAPDTEDIASPDTDTAPGTAVVAATPGAEETDLAETASGGTTQPAADLQATEVAPDDTAPVTGLAETTAALAEPADDATPSEVDAALAAALAASDDPPVSRAAASPGLPVPEDAGETLLAALTPDPSASDTVSGTPPVADPRAPDAEILDPEAAAASDAASESGVEAEAGDDIPANTPEATPEIRVIASAPPIAPHLRPRSQNPAAAEATDELADETEGSEDIVAALIEQALTEETAPAVADDIRPRPRPDDLVPEADSAAVAAAADPDAPARSRYALLYSERPRTRPKSFASQVVRVATTPPSDPVPQEPRVQLPTSASVQQAATTRDAINLRNINLLGVAGSDGRRTAIIRMPNGKIVTVKTGDKFSGYQVAAIGRNAIRLRKNGRDTVLEIPE